MIEMSNRVCMKLWEERGKNVKGITGRLHKDKRCAITGVDRPFWVQEVEAPRI
jgi:hypothetical protein